MQKLIVKQKPEHQLWSHGVGPHMRHFELDPSCNMHYEKTPDTPVYPPLIIILKLWFLGVLH